MHVVSKELEAQKRIKHFKEVSVTYTEAQAECESTRCILCPDKPCMQKCPTQVDIPEYIKHIQNKEYDKAYLEIKKRNFFPQITARATSLERYSERACIVGLDEGEEPVQISKLQKYIADNHKIPLPKPKPNKKTVGIVGSGPTSLHCAGTLAMQGYKITIYEAFNKLGGSLRTRIPDFRLPEDVVDEEINELIDLGVEVKFNQVVGRNVLLEDLQKSHDAVFVGTGMGKPRALQIKGEGKRGVTTANEFLMRINYLAAHTFPKVDTPMYIGKQVIVVGGGMMAIDAARAARRLGAEVTICYRRSLNEMTAGQEEIRFAQEEGIQFLMMTHPMKILGEEKVEGVMLTQMMLGEQDYSGRRKPIELEGSEWEVPADQVIIAIGQEPNTIITESTEFMTNPDGRILIDQYFRTNLKKVFAGGEITGQSPSILKCMEDGRKAAEVIDQFLSK